MSGTNLLLANSVQQHSSANNTDLNDLFDMCMNGTDANEYSLERHTAADAGDIINELAELVSRQTNGIAVLSASDIAALRQLFESQMARRGNHHGGSPSIDQTACRPAMASASSVVQDVNVSSSQTHVDAIAMAPMMLDAIDGFFMIINGEALVECVTPNVEKYIGVKQVGALDHSKHYDVTLRRVYLGTQR